MNKTVNRVEEILTAADALLTGHFLYASGRHGDKYMQCAKVQQYPEYMEEIAKTVAKGFEGVKVDYVLAPAVGGIVFGYELARQLKARAVFTERVEGKMVLRRGFELPVGTKVVVAEDVITTGGTVIEVIEVAKSMGADVVGAGSIVDRSGGKVDLGVKTVAALTTDIVSYAPEECPLCKQGIPVVKPGSRGATPV